MTDVAKPDLVSRILPWAQDLENVAKFAAVVWAPAGVAASLIQDGIVAAEAYEKAKVTLTDVMAGKATAEAVAEIHAIVVAVPEAHPVAFVMKGRSAVSPLQAGLFDSK